MESLPELKGGEKLRLTNGLVVEVVKIGGRKARQSEFEEPLYRIKYPAHFKNGWSFPESIGTAIWTLEDLAESVSEVVS